MRKDMEEERLARRRLEASLKTALLKLNNCNSKDETACPAPITSMQ